MIARLVHICRHPIKSVGYEPLDHIDLTAGRALPFDRQWAVAHQAAKFGTDLAEWAPKRNFLRGVAGPELMAISAVTDEPARRITLTHPRAGALSIRPDDPADAARLIDWLRPLWPEGRPDPAFVAHVPGLAMTDVPDQFLSVLNLASNRALSDRLGADLSIHRWRGNLWIDGLEPFAEFGLIGQRLRIGNVELKIEEIITRCKATTVNPETGQEDVDTLGALQSGYGHQDFGVYALVTTGGRITLSDPVTVVA